MSPQEPLPVPDRTLAWQERLSSEYAVTTNGFIPLEAPLNTLSSPYYQPWEDFAVNMSTYLKDSTLRSRVDTSLPLLTTTALTSDAEYRRSYLILTFLCHAYVWGGGEANPSEHLPPQIAVPLLAVSEHLKLPPVATYAATALWNFRSLTNTPFSNLDDLQALVTFTGTPDESWFFMVSVAMECEGGAVMPAVLAAMDTISLSSPTSQSYAAVTNALEELMGCIKRVGAVLDRMHERCDPEVFYHAIRPFLAGSKGMAAAGLPRGVFYDQGNGLGTWQKLRGGSNGQSSLIQFFDTVLGVEHKATEVQTNSEKGGEKEIPFHEEVRGYMPAEHRELLRVIREDMPSIRNFALQEREGEEQALLRATFQQATKVLAEFRNKHLQIVTRYIVVPSRREQQRKRMGPGLAGVAWREPPQNPVALPKEEASAVADGSMSPPGKTGGRRPSETQLTGTGGTALMPFLKQVRDETVRAGKPDDIVPVAAVAA